MRCDLGWGNQERLLSGGDFLLCLRRGKPIKVRPKGKSFEGCFCGNDEKFDMGGA